MWLKRKEAAARLGISPTTYDKYRRVYGLPASRMGMIDPNKLDAWWSTFTPPKDGPKSKKAST